MQITERRQQVLESTYITPETETALYRSLRDFWHPVCYASDLTDDKPLGTQLMDERIVVARLADGVSAFRDLCVHRGAALSLGWVEEGRLRCAYHGWTYRDDGQCVEVPARPDLPIPRGACLRQYHAAEAGGLIWVCLGEPKFDVPEFPQFDDPGYRIITGPSYDWKSSAVRRIENFVDMAHFAWVHPGVLGSRDHPEVDAHDVWRDGRHLKFEHTVKQPNNGELQDELGVEGDVFDVRNVYHLSMPLAIHMERYLPNDARYVVFMVSSPLSQKVARSFWFIARNYLRDEEQDTGFLEFEQHVLAQDKPIIESLRPEEIPMDLTKEMYVRVADAITVEYRRWLLEFARAKDEETSAGANGTPSRAGRRDN